MTRPLVKPFRPQFSSGPCAKRPGWSLDVLKQSSLGRSHRHKVCKNKLKEVIELCKSILNIPDDYLLGIVPGSDTGAIEIAMWNLLGSKPVTMLVWDSFGADWAKDIELQLKLKNLNIIKVDYGKLPNLNDFDFKGDIVFNWNGTTAGVCVPNGDWIKNSRDGLTICDATSAAFAMDIDWSKLDVGTFSWQKSLGGEAGHGMIILSPKAIDRINTYSPNWPIPKLFQLKKNNEINLDIFSGSTINTPSMICVEDFLDVLNWTNEIGGLEELIRRSRNNLNIIKDWVILSSWVDFLCEDPNNISNTSICLKLIDPKLTTKSLETKNIIEKNIIKLLEENNVAFDIGSYRSAPPGLRIWGGPTVDNDDIKKLLPWLDWAYNKSLRDLDI
ncbi:MAG: phosphoserine aminotransferase [Alphaproteobacteria bacterium TMED199]|nr:MAG: phosphoserine aminotransferase [Alphaproteobacteria bacterium TMED199]